MNTPPAIPGRKHWWWASFKTALDSNPHLNRLLYWVVPGRPAPGPRWTPRERQAIEFSLWMYEVDARVTGKYLYGMPVSELGPNCLEGIIQPMLATEGKPSRWQSLLNEDPGIPLGLKDDRIACPVTKDARQGFTPWLTLAGALPRKRSRVAVTFNLLRNNRSICEAFNNRSDEIGIRVSRRKLVGLLGKLRKRFRIPSPTRSATKGERRVRPVWDWIQYLDLGSSKRTAQAKPGHYVRTVEARHVHALFLTETNYAWHDTAERDARVELDRRLVH